MRRKRHERLSNPPPMRLTERDQEVIKAVYQHRVLSQQQIQRLIFSDNHPSIAQTRLRQLFDHGYLQRRFLPSVGGIVSSPVLYLLDHRGSQLLLSSGYDEIRWQPSDNKVGYEHLEHLLAINTFRIELSLASRYHPDFQLLHWSDDTTLKQDYDKVNIQGKSRPVAVIPDGFFYIEIPTGKTYFFLELDRGTMTSKRFKQKILAYIAYQHSGKLQSRFDTTKFRVLTVTESHTRTANLKEATEDCGGQSRFWFGTLADLTADTILQAPVWAVAGRDGQWALIN